MTQRVIPLSRRSRSYAEDYRHTEQARHQSAVIADRVEAHAAGALIAQKTIIAIADGEDHGIALIQLLELVARHGVGSAIVAAFVNELARRASR